MELGEKVEADGTGCVYGVNTGRVIAKFSHVHDAKSFVDMVNGPSVETWIRLANIAFTAGEWTHLYKDASAEFDKISNTVHKDLWETGSVNKLEAKGSDRVASRFTVEYEQTLRGMINPRYADQSGTESYERKTLLAVIDHYRNLLKMAVKDTEG